MRVAAVVLASCLLGLAACRPPAGGAATARPASTGEVNFVLKGADGQQLDFKSLRGKVVLVDVWATWCGPCVRSLPGLARLSKIRPDDLAVVGVLSGDDPSRLGPFLQRQPVPYFMGVEDATTRSLFPHQALPTVYVVNRDGRVVDKIVGGVPESELMRRAQAHF